ncbi:MAG: lycopene beta-cyclase CrtY [Pseudomonadota bacterium]|nr:lycopene beta-cyclase CrtY [Pseudomonadota bacterium]
MHDLVLVGGGLANSLIALRLKALRPELKLLVLEQGPALGARHTWSFFDTDVTAAQRAWLEPLVVHRWPGYAVRFPGLNRRLSTPYGSATSERLHAVVSQMLGPAALRLQTRAARIEPTRVTLTTGEAVPARAVIDGRGPEPTGALVLAWQKFLGRTLRLVEPHGLTEPVVMDATVPQLDGYRFIYVLPFDERRLLLEDTYYSDGPALDRGALRSRLEAYALSQGWRLEAVEAEEEGVLPIALGGDMDRFWAGETVARAGLRSGLFHPTTGYSLADAAALADAIAGARDLSGPALLELTRRRAQETWRRRGFYRLLNRMLFRAAEPAERWRVLQRFYGLPQPLVERFYAGRTTRRDAARILCGRPPVPIRRAASYLSEQSVTERRD